jgi:hypothetical protein
VRHPHFPDPDLDRPFGGETLTSLLGQAKQILTRQPSAEVAAAHLAQMTEAARGVVARGRPRIVEVAPRRRSGLRALRRAAVTFAVVVLAGASSMAGLAYAGVHLPSAVLTAFNDVGIHLPNQAQGRASAPTSTPSSSLQHGQDVRVIATTGPHGCVHGRAVSAAAGSGSEAADPCAQGHRSAAGSRSSGTSTGTEQQDAVSSTSGTTSFRTHRKPSGDGSSTIAPTHGGSGKTGNQGKGKGGSLGHTGHSNSGSRGSGKSQERGRN